MTSLVFAQLLVCFNYYYHHYYYYQATLKKKKKKYIMFSTSIQIPECIFSIQFRMVHYSGQNCKFTANCMLFLNIYLEINKKKNQLFGQIYMSFIIHTLLNLLCIKNASALYELTVHEDKQQRLCELVSLRTVLQSLVLGSSTAAVDVMP